MLVSLYNKMNPPYVCICCRCLVASIVSHSVGSYGLQPARLLCSWDSLGKSTREGCHTLLQGIFLTEGSNPGLLHCRHILYHWATREVPPICIYPPFGLPSHSEWYSPEWALDFMTPNNVETPFSEIYHPPRIKILNSYDFWM